MGGLRVAHVLFSILQIQAFLKTSRIYVNTSDNSFYIGSIENLPVKLITELNIGDYETGSGGGDEPSTNPEWPDKSTLTLGNTVSFAAREWIVSHITETEAYLTFKDLAGYSTWDGLQSSCTLFEKQLTEEQKACLKRVTADSTSGKVFVATYTQMNGGFSYFKNQVI